MDYKKEITNLLTELKTIGIDRDEIEAGIEVGNNYIDQVLARGGNRTAYAKIKLFRDLKLQNATFIQKRNHQKTNAPKKNTVPFFDAPAAAGIAETEMTPIHAPAGTIDVGDLLHDSQAAIRIYGNSMIPNYPPGCVVGLARCQSKFIEPGEVYVIETRDRRILKRLFYKDDSSDNEMLTCYSDNTMLFEGGARNGKLAYPPFDLPKKRDHKYIHSNRRYKA